MKQFGALLCGSENTDGIAKKALSQLSTSISDFSGRSISYLREPDLPEMQSFGPFCARVLLENGCAALVGRLDTFRLLYLSEFQDQPQYDLSKRAKSAFSWAGDVIPEEKPNQALWSTDTDVSRISRALFSSHLEHVYWKPAIEKLLDFISQKQDEPLLTELKTIDSETYISAVKGRSLLLYSKLSKGVHWEFYTTTLLFDRSTLIDTVRDTLLLVSQIGLASHFIPTAYASLKPDEAIENYLRVRKEIP